MNQAIRVMTSAALLAGLFSFLLASTSSSARTQAERLESGRRAFLASCAMCHGDGGAGDGPLSASLAKEGNVTPAKLDDGVRLRQLGRKGVHQVIIEGGGHRGKSNLMPAWGDKLSPQLADDITDYVMTLPDSTPGIPSATIDKYLAAPPGVPEDGRKLFVYHCTACHGPYGKGDGPYAQTLRTKYKAWPRNLTQTSYFAQKSDQDIYVAIALGGGHIKKSTLMPAWTYQLQPDQIKDLVAYVRALSNTPSRP